MFGALEKIESPSMPTSGGPWAEAVTDRQPVLFQRLRWLVLRNTVTVIIRGSWVRLATILFCSAIIWGVVFALARSGFAFLALQNIFLAGGIVGTLFDLLFLSLTVLLIFSSGI